MYLCTRLENVNVQRYAIYNSNFLFESSFKDTM